MHRALVLWRASTGRAQLAQAASWVPNESPATGVCSRNSYSTFPSTVRQTAEFPSITAPSQDPCKGLPRDRCTAQTGARSDRWRRRDFGIAVGCRSVTRMEVCLSCMSIACKRISVESPSYQGSFNSTTPPHHGDLLGQHSRGTGSYTD